MKDFILPFLLAAATGILSGWGVGGGTLLTVCMTLLLKIDHRQAQAVNLLFFLPTAAISLWFHRKKGLVDKELWVQAAVPGTSAALMGAIAALSMEVSLLRKPFGIFLILNGAMMLWSGRKGSNGSRTNSDRHCN